MDEKKLGKRQVLEPIEQEAVPFKDHEIIAVRLDDGRIAIVLKWICDVLCIDAHAQTQRIERTESLANELVYVRVQPRKAGSRGGGAQPMYALTLRGFSPWVLGINPSEVKARSHQEAEHIRGLIIAYQEEAKDILYEHFVNKRRTLALPAPHPGIVAERPTPFVTVPPPEPGEDATDDEQAAYYEDLAVWAMWKARYHAQRWRGQIAARLEDQEARLEGAEAMTGLLPEIIDRLGPETITPEHQGQVRGMVKRLHELTGKPYPTIYDELRRAFGPAKYQDLLESDWSQVEAWFLAQIDVARKRRK